jgi:rSAM/selenodomain-associated transferase 1
MANDPDPLTDVRARIDTIDREIVALLARRHQEVERARRAKAARGAPHRDHAREAAAVSKWRDAAEGAGLDPDAVAQVARAVVGVDLAPGLVAVALFVRAPVPGRTKTRLAATVGDVAAADWYAACAKHVWNEIVSVAGAVAEAWVADPADHAEVQRWLGAQRVRPQPPGDLGVKQAAAVAAAFAAGHRGALLVASDTPDVSKEYVHSAIVALRKHDVVLGPAADGGYALLGLAAPPGDLFDGVAWSTSSVAATLRERAAARGWSITELDPLIDVDTHDDMLAWARQASRAHPLRLRLPQGASAAPRAITP